MSELEEVLRTGQLYQADMADFALQERGIPHFLRQETSSGLRLAMPICPSMVPGTWWIILVPAECAADAREVITELPFETSSYPDVWDCQPNEESRMRLSRGTRIGVVLILLLLVLSFLGAALFDIFWR